MIQFFLSSIRLGFLKFFRYIEVEYMKIAKVLKWFVMAILIVLGVLGSAKAADVSQEAVLSGKVIYVIAPMTPVKEGDVLVSVDSLVGAVPAARADADGVVKEVLVKVGDHIDKKESVAVVETN